MSAVPDDFSPVELRPVPAALESEQYVIGAALIHNPALASVADWLGAQDFFTAKHRAIWRAIGGLAASGKPFDAVTVGEALAGSDEATMDDAIGLAAGQSSAANIVAHAEIVLEKSRLRQVMDLGQRLAAGALQPKASSTDLVAIATHAMAGIATENRGGLQPLKPSLHAWFRQFETRYESGNRLFGRATPWCAMNEITHGLRPGELVVVAARPGMGKSILGFSLATFDGLREGGRVALFSLEMTAEEYVQRQVSAVGNVPHEWLRAPDNRAGSDAFWSGVTHGVSTLMGANVLIDDTPGLTVAQIAARARRAHMQGPLSMVVVDHMHIVRIKGDNPVRELGDISRGLKALAKELRVPVVALAQLNRANTTRTDKRPTMADLRGSGEIEQDADYVFLLHRQDYYDDADDSGAVEVIVGKCRNASPGTVVLKNRLDVMRFDDWEGPVPDRGEKRGSQRGFGA